MPGKLSLGLLAFTCLPLLIILFLVVQNLQQPELGHTQGRFKPLSGKPNAVSSQTDDPARYVAPLPFKDDMASTHQALIAAAMHWGGAEIIHNQPDYLHIVFKTPILRFRDDVEFYIDNQHKNVEYRSASRAGYSDMGVNRKRYEGIRTYYLAME